MFTKKNILTHLFFLIIAVGLKRYGVTARLDMEYVLGIGST